jgi:hypothetical protein
VTLTGVVTYGRQREAAELAVSGLTGVRNVRDEIDISFDANPLDVTVLVQAALDRNALISDDSDRDRGHQGQHGDADRARTHLGRTRRRRQCGLDGWRPLRGPR